MRFASRAARGQRGIRELAKIAEYVNMGLRGEVGILPAKNRPQMPKNGRGTVKTDIGGIRKPKRAEMGAR